MRKLLILALLIGLSVAQKPTQREIVDGDWVRILSNDGKGLDYTRGQFLNSNITKTNTYAAGAFSLKIIDTFTELGASAHKSINVDLTYTPKIAGVSAAGAAAPVGIASKLTLTTGMTRNAASSNYQGLGWAVQGQIHTPTGATYAGEAATDPGMIMAGLRGVLTDAGTSTYTNGTFTGAYLESQVSQDVTTGDFRHFLLWCRNQGSGTATNIDAAIYIDEGDAWTNTIQIGIDINNTVKGLDIMASTTGIDFSSSMTQEILGQNNETIDNATNGNWNIAGANLTSTSNAGTADSSSVVAAEYGDGFQHTTVLTLTNHIIGTPNAGNNDDFGSCLYTFPAGTHVQQTMYYNIGLTVGTQTDDTPEIGIGSVEADGTSATLDNGTEEDYILSNAWTTVLTGGAEILGPVGASAGVLTGISLNVAANSKKVFLNAADGWNASVTGNLTATGTVIIVWNFLE